MGRVHLFADESGNMDFSAKGSRYFILTTILLDGFSLGDSLQQLRRELGWHGIPLLGHFHATEDTQAVRDEVFNVIKDYRFRIDATIIEKRKVRPYLYNEVEFYKTAWYYHMKYVAPRVVNVDIELFVVSASLGTKRRRTEFGEAVADVVSQTCQTAAYRTASWDASCEPCLQAADYCCWAIQRKWEKNDQRSYAFIRDKIASEFDIFRVGRQLYY